MLQVNRQYHQLLSAIKESGKTYTDESRENTELTQLSSVKLSLELNQFPLINTKKLSLNAIIHEFVWIVSGRSNIKYLVDNKVNIWNKDAYNFYSRKCQKYSIEPLSIEDFISEVKKGTKFNRIDYQYYGDMGNIYGKVLRSFGGEDNSIYQGHDQLANLIKGLRVNPFSRRNNVSYLDPGKQTSACAALPPCHWSFEVIPYELSLSDRIRSSNKDREYLETLWNESVRKNNKEAGETLEKELQSIPKIGMTLKWRQRSVDTFLGKM